MTTGDRPQKPHGAGRGSSLAQRACVALCAGVAAGCASPPASDLGCDRAQGFLIAPPLRPLELAHWVLTVGAEWRSAVGEPAPAPHITGKYAFA